MPKVMAKLPNAPNILNCASALACSNRKPCCSVYWVVKSRRKGKNITYVEKRWKNIFFSVFFRSAHIHTHYYCCLDRKCKNQEYFVANKNSFIHCLVFFSSKSCIFPSQDVGWYLLDFAKLWVKWNISIVVYFWDFWRFCWFVFLNF